MPEGRHSWPVLIGVAALALLTAAGALMVSQSLARNFNLVLYAVATLSALLDLFDLVLRLHFCRVNGSRFDPATHAATSVPLDEPAFSTQQKRTHLRPYAIIASIHNAEDVLDEFLQAMAPYRERVWLIDDASTDLTAARLRHAGWRCVRSACNAKKPGALKALFATLPGEIETVVVIDPDITIRGGVAEVESVIFDFQRSGMAAACPRIAIKEDGLLARFQALEYCMSFSFGRRSLGDHCVTSGISIYGRADLEALLERHSLSVYAEDLENSVILIEGGRPVYYDGRLVVETEGKRTWKEWFSQRVGWHYGLLRVYGERFDAILRAARGSFARTYHYLVYTGVFSIVLQPLKIAGLILVVLGLMKGFDGWLGLDWMPDSELADPAYLIGAYAKYTLLALLGLFLAVPRRERAAVVPIVPLYFFYSLAYIVPASVGYGNWVALRLGGRRLFADHYQEEATLTRAAKER